MNAHHPPGPRKARRATTVAIDPALIDEARALSVDISLACERGLADAIDNGRTWLAENSEALDESNAYVAEHGLPLAKYRLF